MFETKKINQFEKLYLELGEEQLTIADVIYVARYHERVGITNNEEVLSKIDESCAFITEAVANGQPIYGVTSGFGGMANVAVSPQEAMDLQNNLVLYHKVGAGNKLPKEDIRASMLLRAKSHIKGISGIRYEFLKRIAIFLNEDVIPHVYEYGSIGASGDLTPLAYITGSLAGLNKSFKVDFKGEEMDAISALKKLDLKPIKLLPKEGLAMMNGTSVMSGIAANCFHDSNNLLQLSMVAHALLLQGINGTNQSFHGFIHQNKPHDGQIWAASKMLDLLNGSGLIRDELDGTHDYRGKELIQDRYSLRCLAQFIGPVADGYNTIKKQIEVEMNATTDNPLIDVKNEATYHGGNFLGQYIAVAMDQLRYYHGLLSKHLDAQIALLVAPEFSNGLSASLKGNKDRSVNMGLKALQITANSLMPLISFYGNSLADRFPTHAEQFNQNINSQGFGSANLTRKSIDVFQQYVSVALMFGIQAVDLRTKILKGHYDASQELSSETKKVYLAIKQVIGVEPSKDKPYVWDDEDQSLDVHIRKIADNIKNEGTIIKSIS